MLQLRQPVLAELSADSTQNTTFHSPNNVMHRQLAHLPFAGLRVVAGGGEGMPLGIVQLRKIPSVVVARPARFLPV